MYHSHSDEVADPLAGLVGMIVIGLPGSMQSTLSSSTNTSTSNRLGTAKDVDKEVFYLFSVMNERSSFMWPLNEAAIAKRDAALADAWLGTTPSAAAPSSGRKLLQEVGEVGGEPASEVEGSTPVPSLMAMAEVPTVENDLMHGINGYVYCNGPPLQVSRGDKVRFHTMAIGTEVDMHSATLSGSNFLTDGQRGPSMGLLAGSMDTSDVEVVAPVGPAVLQCRIADHTEAGMSTLLMVEDSSTNSSANSIRAAVPALTALAAINSTSATKRLYFIQAEETLWDYGPKGRNFCGADGPVPFTDNESLFMKKVDGQTIGSVYTKAVYRRFVNKNFIQRFPVPIEHGILGPVIAAEVGDIIEIYFKNTLNFEVNLKFDAGFIPMPGSADVNAGVPTGKTVKYILGVPESAGPGPSDLNTVTYGYTSSVDLVYHPYSGLIGLALVGAPGAFAGLDAAAMPAEPVPAGVDKMLPLLLAVMNEGETVYIDKNAAAAGIDLTGDGIASSDGTRRLLSAAAEGEAAAAATPPDFEESNLKHAINGYMFCNMPEIHVETGKVVRVATLGLGSEVDIHSVVFSGQSLQGGGESPRGGVEPIMPASAMSANLKATQPGTWVFECLVHDHSEAGMKALLKVDTQEETKSLAAGSAALSSIYISFIRTLLFTAISAVFITLI
jgi:hephaestin